MSTQNLTAEDEMYEQMNHFRKTAFLAVAFSTVAVLACVVGLPLAYTYIQKVHSNMQNEMDYCKVSKGGKKTGGGGEKYSKSVKKRFYRKT